MSYENLRRLAKSAVSGSWSRKTHLIAPALLAALDGLEDGSLPHIDSSYESASTGGARLAALDREASDA